MDKIIYASITEMSILTLLIIIGISLYVLGKGADILVNEAIGLSVRWGIPKMIIGATIVSLGTTIPEVTVSVFAAVNGNPDLALGNAMGSIIVNTGLILGLAALVGTLPINREILGKQGSLQLLAGLLLAGFSLPILSKGSSGIITQTMGFVFLGLLALYLVGTVVLSRQSKEDSSIDMESKEKHLIIQLVKLILGTILVIISSKILIPSVEVVAIRVGIPQSIIAATLIAFGTSLPELVTSITAVRKGYGELAIGNVTGANILNILFVVGSSAAVSKNGLLVPNLFYKLQIPVMILLLALFYIFSKDRNDLITSLQGFILLGVYIVYLSFNYIWI